MRPLSIKEMIGVWEDGNCRSPIDQALLLLHAGAPDDSLQDLAKLHVGERDRRLLELRERTIGRSFPAPWNVRGAGRICNLNSTRGRFCSRLPHP